jgi:hypothetical protein
MGQRVILGLDLGQAQDPSALAALRESALGPDGCGRTRWEVPYLRRWPLRTSYPSIVRDVGELAASLDRPSLVIDATGVGRPVLDLFDEARLPVSACEGIVLTGGHQVTRGGPGIWNVPKRDVVGAAMRCFQSEDRLRIAQDLKEAATLTAELSKFRAKINIATGNESYEAWRERDHDDLVLALAIALWWVETTPGPEAWNLRVITLPSNAQGRPTPVPPPPLSSGEVRHFFQSGQIQACPTINGQKVYGPEFRTEPEAVYAAGLIRHAAGEPRPGAPEGLDVQAARRVLEKVGRWLEQAGRANGLPAALPPE